VASGRLVQKHLRPKWGKLPAANISRSHVKAMMVRIKAPIVADQTLAAASAIYSFAIKEELGGVKVNPCHGVEQNATQSRERVLSATEMALFWKAFEKAGVQGAVLKVLLLLGQRPGETTSMRKEHIVDGWWEMPMAPPRDPANRKPSASIAAILSRAFADLQIVLRQPNQSNLLAREGGLATVYDRDHVQRATRHNRARR
jgi:hypothetical protein